MKIDIRKLTPDLLEDYIRFFDENPHNQRRGSKKCYCVFWCDDDSGGKDFSSKKARRDYSTQYVRDGNIQGYLAYYDDNVVGWCNANTKSNCLKCRGWQWMNGKGKGLIPTEEVNPDIKVKSVFCFAVSPKFRRQGIASQLLDFVCRDAAENGFDFVEAYPDKVVTEKSEDHVGYKEMYIKSGFTIWHETNIKFVMRKHLK